VRRVVSTGVGGLRSGHARRIRKPKSVGKVASELRLDLGGAPMRVATVTRDSNDRGRVKAIERSLECVVARVRGAV
jgi:hypothetical protein